MLKHKHMVCISLPAMLDNTAVDTKFSNLLNQSFSHSCICLKNNNINSYIVLAGYRCQKGKAQDNLKASLVEMSGNKITLCSFYCLVAMSQLLVLVPKAAESAQTNNISLGYPQPMLRLCVATTFRGFECFRLFIILIQNIQINSHPYLFC